jgi:uncharacterized protein YjbI with pentapeptide repeats
MGRKTITQQEVNAIVVSRNMNESWQPLDFTDVNMLNISFPAGTDLSSCDFGNSFLSNCSVSNCDLSYSSFQCAALFRVQAENTNFICCGFNQARLDECNFKGANLRDVCASGLVAPEYSLKGAVNSERLLAETEILPREGTIIGWKKGFSHVCIYETALIKLLIPAEAIRTNSPYSRKCRASAATVLSIETVSGENMQTANSMFDKNFVYEVGATVKVDNFCADRFASCAAGIHFFLTREEAASYVF